MFLFRWRHLRATGQSALDAHFVLFAGFFVFLLKKQALIEFAKLRAKRVRSRAWCSLIRWIGAFLLLAAEGVALHFALHCPIFHDVECSWVSCDGHHFLSDDALRYMVLPWP